MDDLLKGIDITPEERAFIDNISGKGHDPDFVERRKASLTFYTLHKAKNMIERIKAVVDRVARTIDDINDSTLKSAERIVSSNENAARSAEKYSRRTIALTVVLAIATAGLFFVGIVEIFTK